MKINCVAGQIDTSELGVTLMHEHVGNFYSDMKDNYPEWAEPETVALAFKKAMDVIKPYGFKTFVDATPVNLGRDINIIKRAAEVAEVNILCSTGFYNMEAPWISARPGALVPELMAKWMIRDAEKGIGTSGIKPAQIKCATDKSTGYTEANRNMLIAASLAAKETGLPIYTHTTPGDGKMGFYQQEIFDSMGIEPHRIVIGHSFDSCEPDYIEGLIKNGTYVGCDRIGLEIVTPIVKIIETLVTLIKRGYADHIMLSHDASVFTDFAFSFSPKLRENNPIIIGYDSIFKKVLPGLRDAGISEDTIHLMMVENPRRFYSGEPFKK